MARNVEQICCYYPEQTVEQTIEFSVIWDAVTLMLCPNNDIKPGLKAAMMGSPAVSRLKRQLRGSQHVSFVSVRSVVPFTNMV